VVVGSSFHNFREVVEKMRAVGGIRVVSPDEMAGVWGELLGDEAEARKLGERGRSVFAAETGATERTVGELLRLMGDERRGPMGSGGAA